MGLHIASVESYTEAKETRDLCVENDDARAYPFLSTAAPLHSPLTMSTNPKRLSLARGVKCWSLPALELCDMLANWRRI